MTPEQIIKSCKHCLGGAACTACISSALDEARVAAVTAYASGNAHVCQNGKLKLIPEPGCRAGCQERPRRSIRETAIFLDGRMRGWVAAKEGISASLPDYAGDAKEFIQDALNRIPDSWSSFYTTDKGEITG